MNGKKKKRPFPLVTSAPHFSHHARAAHNTETPPRKHKEENKMPPIPSRTPVQKGCFTDKYEVRQKLGKGAQVRRARTARSRIVVFFGHVL